MTLIKRTVLAPWIAVTLLLARTPASAQVDSYEEEIQLALRGIYTVDDQAARVALNKMETLRPDFPAPLVYAELLDSWRAADDPLNESLIRTFEEDADKAIAACLKWTRDHPKDADGWRYLASAYGQRARFAEKIQFKHSSAALYARKTRKAVDTAYSLDKNNADILLGVGGAHYFASHLPFTLRLFAWFIGIHGDRDAGLKELARAMKDSQHSRIEAATVLAGAYWTESDYDNFQNIIAGVSSQYPELLSVRAWRVEGWICSNQLSDPGIEPVIQHTETPEGWKALQRGRIALAQGDWSKSAELFSHALASLDANVSVRALACKGMEQAGRIQHSDFAVNVCPKVPAPDEIFSRTFPTPGKCRH